MVNATCSFTGPGSIKTSLQESFNLEILFQTYLLATEYINMGGKFSLLSQRLIVSVDYFMEDHSLEQYVLEQMSRRYSVINNDCLELACILHLILSSSKRALFVGHGPAYNMGGLFWTPPKESRFLEHQSPTLILHTRPRENEKAAQECSKLLSLPHTFIIKLEDTVYPLEDFTFQVDIMYETNTFHLRRRPNEG